MPDEKGTALPSGGRPTDIKPLAKGVGPVKLDYDGSVYFAENAQWTPGKVVQFVGAGRETSAVIATGDGRIVSVKLSEVRHGVEPESLPHLHPVTASGVRQYTLTKHHTGKFIVASPDGVVKGEYDDENDAKARHEALNSFVAPPPVAAKPWKEAS